MKTITLSLAWFVPWLLLGLWATPFATAADLIHVPIPGGVQKLPRKVQNESCLNCHFLNKGTIIPAKTLPRKYSIASAFITYLESPHGRLKTLGEERAPGCEDCHLTREWKDILTQEHPNSPIHPTNLARTCAKCHGRGMLKAKVMDGSMHLELRRRSLLPGEPLDVRYGFLPGLTKMEKSYYIGPFDVVAYINFLFLVLTVGTLSSLSIYMVLDLRRKLIERKKPHTDETHAA